MVAFESRFHAPATDPPAKSIDAFISGEPFRSGDPASVERSNELLIRFGVELLLFPRVKAPAAARCHREPPREPPEVGVVRRILDPEFG